MAATDDKTQGHLDTLTATVESPNLPNAPRPDSSQVLCHLSCFVGMKKAPLHLDHLDSAALDSVTQNFSWGAGVAGDLH